MKKQLLAVLLAGMLLAGCGNNAEEPTGTGPASPPDTGATSSPPPPPEEEPQEEGRPTQDGEDTPATGDRALYQAMLDDIEANMDDLEAKYEEGTTASMREAAGEEYKRWDDALNEIYTALGDQLSDTEMDQLRDEQREWIAYRDETAEQEASGSEGGTLAPLEQTMAMARLTKERCYELVDTYMS
ncbi:hypothetical protein PA598K_04528 [Paenibacillus sp. 598K]|uniref:lysozyme inhibitor LprI family protein n=1 Tax=Paenibacillus sp. 598K TaxID=1117987 RepID=UPI000FFA2A3E|nr:lysozyme inhibitor LprI family protein [Paenibacillus sp. 598K]GBF76085.1 hypothetical protein PA598K_04528 [Paenibacillus sp. 598K]